MIFLTLLAAAGITFGLQHKAPFIHKRYKWLDSMLKCTFCTGFHGGWVAYLLSVTGMPDIRSALLFAFGGAIFSYALDELVKYFEEAGYGVDQE